jgi:hypothetical protein
VVVVVLLEDVVVDEVEEVVEPVSVIWAVPLRYLNSYGLLLVKVCVPPWMGNS